MSARLAKVTSLPALALRYGAAILDGPREPLIAAAALVLVLLVPPLFERPRQWMRTLVQVTLIRNLSLALSPVAVAAAATASAAAFGSRPHQTDAGVLPGRPCEANPSNAIPTAKRPKVPGSGTGLGPGE